MLNLLFLPKVPPLDPPPPRAKLNQGQAQSKAQHENKLCDTISHCKTRQMVPETLTKQTTDSRPMETIYTLESRFDNPVNYEINQNGHENSRI